MNKTALITGACGFVGRHAAREFSNAGYHVVGIGHGSWRVDEFKAYGLSNWYESDITLDNLIAYAIKPDVIVHCAGSGSVAHSIASPYQDYLKTVAATAAVLEYQRLHARNANLIYPSSAAVYGNAERLPIQEIDATQPVSPYGVHKLMAEQLCQSYAHCFNLPIAIVRFFSIYGAGLQKQLLWDASQKIMRNETDFFGTGEEVRDWLHVEDAAKLLLVTAERASNSCPIFNGGSGESATVKEVLTTLFAYCGKEDFPTFSGVKRDGDPLGYVADIAKATATGWQATITLQNGLQAYAKWFKEQHA